MRAQLDRLRQRLDSEFTERLRAARGFGASRENDEYLQIKEEEAVLASRLRQLESLLATAEVVAEDLAARVVTVGSIVEVRNLESGSARTHRITGGFEPVQSGDVSANSPVGQALLGRSPGERIEVDLPNGRIRTLEVLEVRPAPPKARPNLA